jgi:hypothetical protein
VTRRNGSRAEAGRWEEGNEDFLGDGTPEPGAAHPRGGAAPAARPRHFADSDPPTGERGVTAGTVYFVIDGTARLGPYSGLGSAEFIQCARPGSQIVSALAEELPPPPPPEPPPPPPPTLLEQVVSDLWGDPDSLSPEDRDAHLRSAYEKQFALFAGKLRAPKGRHRGIGAIEGVEGRADRDAECALRPVIEQWRRGDACRELRRARGLIAEVAGDLHAAEGRLREAKKRVQAARATGRPDREWVAASAAQAAAAAEVSALREQLRHAGAGGTAEEAARTDLRKRLISAGLRENALCQRMHEDALRSAADQAADWLSQFLYYRRLAVMTLPDAVQQTFDRFLEELDPGPEPAAEGTAGDTTAAPAASA